MFLIFDTETTGLPKDWNAPLTDLDNWPRVVQLAWQIHDEHGKLVEVQDHIIYPDGFDIPFNATKVHGISTQRAKEEGQPLERVLTIFKESLTKCTYVVGHNISFDLNVTGAEYFRVFGENPLPLKRALDSCTETTAALCQIPGGRGGKFKLPKLEELHEFLFHETFAEAHNAAFDVEATARVFLELLRQSVYTAEELQVSPAFIEDFIAHNPEPIAPIGLAVQQAKEKRNKGLVDQEVQVPVEGDSGPTPSAFRFAHLHNHSQFSVLQATTKVADLVNTAVEQGHSGVAITDLGNLMAAFQFNREVMRVPGNREAYEHNLKVRRGQSEEPLKPVPFKGVIGSEFFICEDRLDKTKKDDGYQVVLLAKNLNGYYNLSKLSSEANLHGFYYVPRIDKEFLLQHKDDLIVLSGGVRGEISHLLLNVGEKQALDALHWWHEHFGEDFYLELNRHNLDEEDHVNAHFVRYSKEYGIPLVATNNTFYLTQNNAEAHDILLCVKEGAQRSMPIGRGRGFRYGFPNDEFYFKSKDEMAALFADVPEALENTAKILDKIELYSLERDVFLPKFDIPEQFVDPLDAEDGGKRGENAYLRHLTYEGARARYGELTPAITERIDFELETIARTGYPGYFLIVQDFCAAARKMGVSVGPGRGSAAGSVVAYCNAITNIDPIKYDLLFERFLNPERVSLPDIDIDFDDEGRERVIQYVIDKYGSSQVAQIITYGTMAAKSAIKDAARVMEFPLAETERLTKLVPDATKLSKIWDMGESDIKSAFNSEVGEQVKQLLQIGQEDSDAGRVLRQARILEGSLRNTGIHACGVIITPSDIREMVPVARAKDNEIWCTQFDNGVVEDAGLLKMDFLGLRTLTIIKEACALVELRHGITLNPDDFPLDDPLTYELFQRGETTRIFQYESGGMQKYLKALKPTEFGDLIAMNALYRPGPMEYIGEFIDRKHGKSVIEYPIEEMSEYLQETYGITVYQEQVMLLSQKLAGFTKGQADQLRKAMGKKQRAVLDKMKPDFLENGVSRGHRLEILEKIWTDWEAFASYAFNKSHSTCYAYVAFQTAYLKAHYPAEFMASNLSNYMNDLKEVTLIMEECRRMGIPVLGPSVNESHHRFTVNQEGAIRFGLGGMRGVGGNAVQEIIEERSKNGKFSNLFEMLERIDIRQVNRKTLEALVLGGALDEFGNERSVYFTEVDGGRPFLEKAVRYAQNKRTEQESAQVSMFGTESSESLPAPEMPKAEPWPKIVNLKKEKEINGMYLSAHPLDQFKFEIDHFCNGELRNLHEIERFIDRDLILAGIVTSTRHSIGKNGQGFGFFKLEDYTGDFEFALFGENYVQFKHFFESEQLLYLRIRPKKRQRRVGDKVEERIVMDYSEVGLLGDLLEKKAKALQINIALEEISQPLVDFIHDAFSAHPGTSTTRIHVIDAKHKLDLHMPIMSLRVAISSELVQLLATRPELNVRIKQK